MLVPLSVVPEWQAWHAMPELPTCFAWAFVAIALDAWQPVQPSAVVLVQVTDFVVTVPPMGLPLEWQ